MTSTEVTELTARIAEMKLAIEFLEEETGETAATQRAVLARYEEALEDAERAADRSHALHARPQAGAPAANQYGVFQVSYATEKQTNFIKALLDRKDLSGVDPKKVDIDALREQVANVQVNKKAASAIIDTLLALPDAAVPVTQGRPASDKQKAFVRTLLAEREGNEEAETIRAALNIARTTNQLNAAIVSDAITRLLEIPKNVARPAVPDGRYALPAGDGHFVFYRVNSPTEGRWAGYTFVVQLVGSVGSWDEWGVTNNGERQRVLDRIAADSEEAARMFGLKAKACGMCGSPLSNPRSRAAGYGETCAANHGFFYPTEEQARDILQERGEEA